MPQDLLPRRLRLALPFTIVTGRNTVSLIAGEDFRFSLSGAGVEGWLPQFLSQMDGRVTLETALSGLPGKQRDAVLEVLEQLYGERVLVDGTVADAHRAAKYSLVVKGCGKLRERLEATGSPNDASQGRQFTVFCQEQLDYRAALEFNQACRLRKDPWLWATCGPMARGYVSPVFWSDAGPCLHCLLRSFQRISPAPELYDQLMDRSAHQQKIIPVPFPDVAIGMLESLVRWKLSILDERDPPAALYRLHVVEVGTMEISSHRVYTDPECPTCAETQ